MTGATPELRETEHFFPLLSKLEELDADELRYAVATNFPE